MHKLSTIDRRIARIGRFKAFDRTSSLRRKIGDMILVFRGITMLIEYCFVFEMN